MWRTVLSHPHPDTGFIMFQSVEIDADGDILDVDEPHFTMGMDFPDVETALAFADRVGLRVQPRPLAYSITGHIPEGHPAL